MNIGQNVFPSSPATNARRRIATVVVGFLLAVGAVSVAQAPAPALQAEGYYSVPYSSTLYYYDPAVGSAYMPSFEEWSADGFPQPTPAPTSYVKYPWSTSIYAVSSFEEHRETVSLGFAEWQRAGFPRAVTTSSIDGTVFYKWGTDGGIFALTPDEQSHQLNFQEWLAAGFPEPERYDDEGFQKLSWEGSIAYMFSLSSGQGYSISFNEWRDQDFPAPQAVQRFPNDIFCTTASSPSVYYYGPTYEGTVTFSQWRSAGFPATTRC